MSNFDPARYESLRQSGLSALEVTVIATLDGVGPVDRIRILRDMFQLPLAKTKEILMQADASGELQKFHDGLMDELENNFKEQP